MRNLRALVAGALFLALALTAGWELHAQLTNLIPNAFNGQESWPIALQGPGGSSEFTTTAQMRNTTGGVTSTATTGTQTWPGTVGNAQGAYSQYSTIVFTGTIGTMTQDLPPLPFDGQVVEFVTTATGTSLTAASTDGSTLVGTATVTPAASSSFQWYYLKSSNSWYRMR